MNRFGNVKIMHKLMGFFLLAGIFPMAVVGWLAHREVGIALTEKSYEHLEAIRGIKKKQMEQLFAEREHDMAVLTETVEMLEMAAFEKLRAVQKLKKARVENFFRKAQGDILALSKTKDVLEMYGRLKTYHDGMSVSSEEPFDISTDEYKIISDEHSAYFENLVKNCGYDDMLLICAAHGHVMFSTAQKSDLGTNLGHGPYRKESLARLWREVTRTKKVMIEDFSTYTPWGGRQTAFVGAPVYERSNEMLGIIALQLSRDRLNAMVQDRQGMGESGESFLVGRKGDTVAYRSDRTIGSGKIGEKSGDIGISKTSEEPSGHGIRLTETGKPEMSAHDALDIPGLEWGIVSKLDLDEAIVSKDDGRSDDFLTRYARKHGYQDLYLIHPRGRIFYSVRQGADYGVNVLDDRHSGSGLGRLVRQVSRTGKFGMTDFEPYAPDNSEPAALMAQPLAREGDIRMVVAVRVSVKDVNRIMCDQEGMGLSGESYLVGTDKLMRSDSPSDPIRHSVRASFEDPSRGSADTQAVNASLEGRTGRKRAPGYTGSPVFSAHTSLKAGNTLWALVTEMDEDEVMLPVEKLKGHILLAGGAVTLLALALAFVLARKITGPIRRCAEFAGKIENGNFSDRLRVRSGDEIGRLAASLNAMAANMEKSHREIRKYAHDMEAVLAKVASAAEGVAGGGGQISASSQSFSRGANDQAASLEQISASMTEIGSQTRSNAANAAQADQLATRTRELAGQGMREMGSMIAAMKDICAASQSVAKVIKVIDEIAFQTNLLALNAAVEAARAGRHGKGFAVVAGEVRNLAGRSAKAAKETADLIENALARVGEGDDIAHQTGESLNRIVESAVEVADLMSEIAVSSDEQARVIEQVNQGLGEIDRITQQNTSDAEKTSQAAASLSEQSWELRQFLSRFGIGGIVREKDDSTPKERKAPLCGIPDEEAAPDKGKPGEALSQGSEIPMEEIPRSAARKPEMMIPFDEDEM